jgi:hypothetical protein
MKDRWNAEATLVEAVHGQIETGPDLSWFIITCWALPHGWSKPQTQVLILVPSGYPVTPPDNFYVDEDLRLAGGAMPGSTSPDSQAGRQWLRFSYHIESGDWKPHADPEKGHNLLTFLTGVGKRLKETS